MPESAAILSRSKAFAALPPEWPHDVLASNARLAAEATLVVLDDDPTGTQTVRDVPVVTVWDVATLTEELRAAPACFYILTNSRSLTAAASRDLHLELSRNLAEAARHTHRRITVASRSDSTLRGHFPLETDTLAEVLGPFDLTLLSPYFEAGGRYTLEDTHYVADGDRLVPAAETPFARDAAFGYRSSYLPAWIEEKSGGRLRAAEVASISLQLIREGGPDAVTRHLLGLPKGSVCVVNACAPRDIEVVAAATLAVERAGRLLVFRTAAALVAARIGQSPAGLLATDDFLQDRSTGGLIMVGSYVPKTTAQLQRLLETTALEAIELDVAALLDPARRPAALHDSSNRLNAALRSGRHAVVYTSRALIAGPDATASLDIGRRVSTALTAILQTLAVRPCFLVAKGGITSSDLATAGLGVKRAVVRGQLLPGVPVWRLGTESRYPNLDYVVFPGNVGDDNALADAFSRLTRSTRSSHS